MWEDLGEYRCVSIWEDTGVRGHGGSADAYEFGTNANA